MGASWPLLYRMGDDKMDFQKASPKMALTQMEARKFYLLDTSGDFFCSYVGFALWDDCLLMVNVWRAENDAMRFTEESSDREITYMVRPLQSVDLSVPLYDAYDELMCLYEASAEGLADVEKFFVFSTPELPEEVLTRRAEDYPHETLHA